MGRLALVFPGQGSQHVGMGRELAETYPVARAAFEQADAALGFLISKLCFEGPEEELKRTANTQPAILTASVAAFQILADNEIVPDFVAGHSLGEYSALVASGCIHLPEAVRAVCARGTFMQEAVPEGEGAMAAILGLDASKVAEVCKQAAQGDVVVPANLNSPGQVVISGAKAAVERAAEAAKKAGAKRAIPLPVSAPFHSPLMALVVPRLQEVFEDVTFEALRMPLVTNVDAAVIESPLEARDALLRQVSAPVRWEESVRTLIDEGCDTFVEVGPGKVLDGLIKKISRDVTILNVEDCASLDKTLEALKN